MYFSVVYYVPAHDDAHLVLLTSPSLVSNLLLAD